MQPTLFDLPLNQIEYHTVKEFAEQEYPEGTRIEYKEQIPDHEKIARTLAAFANTHGGLLIIGVKTKRINHAELNVPEELVGIDIQGGLETRFTNIALAHIFPPIAPEVKVILFKSNERLASEDRAIVIIRVPESFSAPHELLRQHGIYVRVNDQNRLASLQVIENLINRRETHETLRETLLQSYELEPVNLKPKIVITIVPLILKKQLITFTPEIDSFMKKYGPIGFDFLLPFQNGVKFRITEDTEKNIPSISGVITKEGLIQYKKGLDLDDAAQKQLHWGTTLAATYKLLKYVTVVYEKFNFYDQFLFKLELKNVNGFTLVPIDWPFPNKYVLEGQQDVVIERISHLYKLNEVGLDKLGTSILIELCRAFKWSLDENSANQMYQKIKMNW